MRSCRGHGVLEVWGILWGREGLTSSASISIETELIAAFCTDPHVMLLKLTCISVQVQSELTICNTPFETPNY
jgi:hypothetical protein